MTNWPLGMIMLLGHCDSDACAQAIASFRSVMHAINIGGPKGASVETANGDELAYSRNADDPPPRRLACSSARRPDAGGGGRAHRPAIRPRCHHAEPGAAGDQSRRGGGLP